MMRDFFPFFHYLMSQDSVRRNIDEMFHKLKFVRQQQLDEANHIALTSDIWTDSFNHIGFLGVTAHFINPQGYLTSTYLNCEPFESRHTGQEIANQLAKILDEWSIPKEKIVCLVTDGAANMSLASNILFGKGKHFVCFAHRLNLVAKEALSKVFTVESVILKVKSISQFSHQSNLFADSLREAQSQDEKQLKLIQSVETRWNSVYDMIKRFLDIFEAVTIASLRCPKPPPAQVSQSERALLQEICDLLEPLHCLTKLMSGENYATLSSVIPLTLGWKDTMNRMEHATHEGGLLKQALVNAINEKIGSPEKALIAAVSTILDPRYKTIDFVNHGSSQSLALDKINRELACLPSTDPGYLSQDPSPYSSHPIWSAHDSLAVQVNRSYDVHSILCSSLRHHLDKKPISRLSNPIQYWMSQEDDALKICALKYLIIPASSVPCERMFSKAGNIITAKRSRLSKNRLRKLLYLQSLSIDELKCF